MSKIGGLMFSGQSANGVSFNVEAAVAEGDAVTTTTTAGTLGRGSDGDEIVGLVDRDEGDNVANVKLRGCGKVVTAKRAGAINSGNPGAAVALAVDGAGLVKAGTGTSEFIVIGSTTVDSVDYVTFVL